jgi:hypothetical protein
MPRSAIGLEGFRDEIERRIALRHTHRQILSWLAGNGLIISKNTLSSRVMAWNASRRTRTAANTPALVAAINTAFYTTSHNDVAIAENITAQGIPTTPNQVEEIRLNHGWRRRANNDDQLAEARALTFSLVEKALKEGVVRCYGRGLFKTYLRLTYRYQARDNDVRDALAHLDTRGTESRRRGPDKGRKEGEFIILKPDWL